MREKRIKCIRIGNVLGDEKKMSLTEVASEFPHRKSKFKKNVTESMPIVEKAGSKKNMKINKI